jgi:UDP-glucose 4-epimerase
MAKLLVTGGAGYIGSHTTVELLQAGHDVVCLDNLCNSSSEALARVARICGKAPGFVQADVRDAAVLERVLTRGVSGAPFDAVIHFAALKAVGESVSKPLDYYDNNITGLLTVLAAMNKTGVKRMVFSSSATVYGIPQSLPLTESSPIGSTNPYGTTKVMAEQILADLAKADAEWSVACLRYFNPIGAHISGLIGEDPRDIPNNLCPYVAQVAVGKLKQLGVYGNDWPTVDGTGVRDYIHVVDLALGHLKAVDFAMKNSGFKPINLGTGQGTSVLELVAAFEKASGRPVPYAILPRRPGDIAACYADASLAAELLGWKAERNIADMCTDGWRWQQQNPNGYGQGGDA